MDFAGRQLRKTRELTAARLSAQTKVVERLRELVAAGRMVRLRSDARSGCLLDVVRELTKLDLPICPKYITGPRVAVPRLTGTARVDNGSRTQTVQQV